MSISEAFSASSVAAGGAPVSSAAASPTPAPAASPPSTPATPAATPSTPGSSQTPSSDVTDAPDEVLSPDSVSDFTGLGMEDIDEIPLSEPDAAPQAPQPPSTPEQPVTPAPAAPTAPAPAPAAPAPAAPPGQQEQPAAAPASPPAEPQSLGEQIAKNRDAIIDELAKTQFAFSAEDTKRITDALDTDATKFIVEELPKLKAQIFYEATKAAINHISNYTPRLIQQYLKFQKAHEEQETAFYGTFKSLDKAKHGADVNEFARLFRQSNPQMKQADLLAMVGAAVMAKHGLTAAPAAAPAVNGAPARPQAPPYAPARPGASVRVEPMEPSPWEGLGLNLEE